MSALSDTYVADLIISLSLGFGLSTCISLGLNIYKGRFVTSVLMVPAAIGKAIDEFNKAPAEQKASKKEILDKLTNFNRIVSFDGLYYEVLLLSTLNVVLFITGTTLPVTQKGEDAGFLDGSNINRQVFGAMTFAVAIINFVIWWIQVGNLLWVFQLGAPVYKALNAGKKILVGEREPLITG
jgi:hypothetical protein